MQILERGWITYTDHAKARMTGREFSTQDVIQLLQTGTPSPGYWEPKKRNYEASVTGWDLEGEELELSIAIEISELGIIVVTGKRAR